ncbi:MAG: hypothetical protein RML93_02480, partial [Anaerolineales bacterium]|nr:hypothetical protein [Anaerolineales bacterium]MDW8446142.1 hypothetical protein [Anaerolineales bacterium]
GQSILALQGGVAYPSSPEMEIVQNHMDNILRAVFFQGMSHRTALQQAYDRILAEIQTQPIESLPSP